MVAGDAAAEDESEFFGLTKWYGGIQEPLLRGIDRSATTEDEIVAKTPPGKK